MLFQSQAFVLLLLPITLALYYAFAGRPLIRQAILVLSSLVFYGWWDARFVPLLLGHCVVAWAGPKLAQATGRRGFIDAAIVLQFLSLATFKYTNFLVANAEAVLGVALPKAEILLPIGISFFAFQAGVLSGRCAAWRSARLSAVANPALHQLLPASDRRSDRAAQRAASAVRRRSAAGLAWQSGSARG